MFLLVTMGLTAVAVLFENKKAVTPLILGSFFASFSTFAARISFRTHNFKNKIEGEAQIQTLKHKFFTEFWHQAFVALFYFSVAVICLVPMAMFP